MDLIQHSCNSSKFWVGHERAAWAAENGTAWKLGKRLPVRREAGEKDQMPAVDRKGRKLS